MSHKKNSKPIGIFDSGLGGLTVVREIRKKLPHENIIYLGDLAHLPYGTKSKKEIKERSLKCASYIHRLGIKALVIACNSASSFSTPGLKKAIKVPIFDVITPAVEEGLSITGTQKIGVIATQATIDSGSYTREIIKYDDSFKNFFMISCPLFVPLVEQGWRTGEITDKVIEKYLLPLKKKKVDVLILGCTHYPLLKKAISKFMGPDVKLVTSGPATANRIAENFKKEKTGNSQKKNGTLKVFVTDHPHHFSKIGESFLGESIKSLKLVKL